MATVGTNLYNSPIMGIPFRVLGEAGRGIGKLGAWAGRGIGKAGNAVGSWVKNQWTPQSSHNTAFYSKTQGDLAYGNYAPNEVAKGKALASGILNNSNEVYTRRYS